MKKILVFAIITLIFVTMPFMSFAKTPISESEMDAVTAQEGVTLDFDNAAGNLMGGSVNVTNVFPSVISYGDSDGFTGYTGAGYIGLSNISAALQTVSISDLMTIDVGSSGTLTKLNIGLPIAELWEVGLNATARLDTVKTLSGAGPALGSLFNNTFYIRLNGGPGVSLASEHGSITLASHAATQGVEIGFNNVVARVPSVAIQVSYGDADGFTGYTGAGYFGVNGLLTGQGGGFNEWNPLETLSGTMQIDVGTSGTRTALSIVLPTIQVGPSNITAPLQLSAFRDFTDGQQLLGRAYIGGLGPIVTGRFCMFAH